MVFEGVSVYYMSKMNKKLTKEQQVELQDLIRDNYSDFIAVALNIVHNLCDAEEVVSIAFEYMCRRIINKDSKNKEIYISNAKGYFMRTVKSRGINFLRDKKTYLTEKKKYIREKTYLMKQKDKG